MADIKKSEFENAYELLSKCVGTLRCGCKMDEDDELWARSLFRLCLEFRLNLVVNHADLTI